MDVNNLNVIVGEGTCGIAAGSKEVIDAFRKYAPEINIRTVGCVGMCHQEVITEINDNNGNKFIYGKVTKQVVPKIIRYHIGEGDLPKDHLIFSPEEQSSDKWQYLGNQTRIALRNVGHMGPTSISDYQERDGYKAIKKLIEEMTPEQVVGEVEASHLRGRGGAGFPTHLKWNFARQSEADIKYLICNGDEGDPGAFMDRSLLEGDPHNIIEGMLIAAYAIGSSMGYAYIRAEYPLAVKNFGKAIKDAHEQNILGKNILGSDFSFDIKIKEGAGAFVCGEETALIASIEGERGMPRFKPPFPAIKGLFGKPTIINNVETLANLLLSDHYGDCIAPCEATCPSNVDVQGYIAYISNGNFPAAVKLIKETNPLPVVCGRICPHPCESQCRRGLVDEPVAINPLKRFAAEYELEYGPFLPETKPDTGKKVAIVGGGPAGLSAAYFLRQQGHAVEIHEALPQLGGMTRYGIPRFRLPWDKLDKEIESIIGLGVKVNYNQRLGKDYTIDELKENGANAVLLAIGAHKAKKMAVKNEDVEGVIGGIDFLRKVVLNEPMEIGKRVAVIGGGDTAMDCARVAKRAGARYVTLVYRRSQEEMPALQHEQDETMDEGIDFNYLTAPVAVLEENGKATGLTVISMELEDADDSGRRRPVPIEGSEEDLNFDLIICAIGQDPDLSCVENEKEIPECTKWNTFTYDEKTMVTSIEGVFTAGDCAFGPDTVIRAVSEGKQAAKAINLYLSGVKVEIIKQYNISRGRMRDLDMADFSPRYVHQKRAMEATYPSKVRMAEGGYNAINVGLSEAHAMAESTRCIECGCKAKFDCDLRKYSTEYGIGDIKFKGDRRKYEIDKRHPFVSIEADKCITCGSCVRICSEVRNISALSFVNRGFSTKVTPNFEDPLQNTDCDACGMCIDLCPTGAIAENTGKEYGPWLNDTIISTCPSCPRGCAIKVHTKEGLITKVESVDNDPVNHALICKEGRFAHHLQDKLIEHGDDALKEEQDRAGCPFTADRPIKE